MTRSLLDSVSPAAPPLERAHALQAEAARAGFDWPDAAAMIEKVREETAELAAACAGPEVSRAVADEIGDVLFVLVNLARFEGLDAAECLRGACEKFERRFRAMEAMLEARGRRVADESPESLDALWRAAKAGERAR
jgi:ATP diphosphatase